MLLRILTLFAVAALGSQCALASEPGSGSIEFGLGYYSNPDGGGGADGNPFLDEELTVVEPVVIFDYALSGGRTLHGKFSYDYVSSASIDRLSQYGMQSGASGDYYFGADVGLTTPTGQGRTRDINGHVSVEYDYVSLGAGSAFHRETPDGNSARDLSFNVFYDTIKVIRWDGSEEDSDSRISLSAAAAWYQIIDPLTHAEYGASLAVQNGFLETAYNSVVIEDTATPNPFLVGGVAGREVPEELDDTRIRAAVHGRVRRSLSEDYAAEVGARLYGDSWGITSVSVEPALYTWLVPDALRLRLRLRLYTQTEADAFSEHFYTEASERTQDSDLAAFDSQSVGALLTTYRDGERRFEFSADYVKRSDGLDQILARVAFRRLF